MSKQQLIVECWEQMRKDSVGASELAMIQEAIVAHFGAGQMTSPAWIARTLADHGARLRHPEVLDADHRWREQQQPFASEDLNSETLAFVERLERGDFAKESVEKTVRQLKGELELLARNGHKLAGEYVQWLTVWLQNPAIFRDWVALRRAKLSSDSADKAEPSVDSA